MKLDLDAQTAMPWQDEMVERPIMILAGIRYEDAPAQALLDLLRAGEVHAAMGHLLFWGRDDGPWVAYDRDLKDQNEDKVVRARRFPWCFGDALWIAATWSGMPTSVLLLKDGEDGIGDLYCAVGTGRITVADMRAAVSRRAAGEAGAFVADVDAGLFSARLKGTRNRDTRKR